MKDKRTTKARHCEAVRRSKPVHFPLACFAALAMTLAACSQDEAICPDTAGTPVSFSAGIPTATDAAPQTRTANGGDTWLTTDEIGIIMATGQTFPTDIVAGGDNVKYHPESAGATSTDLTPADAPIYWPETAGVYRFFAYYPWLPVGEGGIDPVDYSYPLDVSDQSDPAGLDLLWAHYGARPGENVSFDFEHKMAKLRVNLTAGGTLTAADLAGATAEANGMPTTGKFSLAYNAFSDKGDIAPIALPAIATGEGYAATFEAIVIHLDYEEFKGRYLKLTLPGAGDYYWTIPDYTMIAGGYIHTFNLTVTADGVSFAGSDITPWDDSGTGTGGKVNTDYVIQPEANSYMVEPNGKAILIPVSQANRVLGADGLGAATTDLGGVTADNYTVELVWGDTPVGAGGVIRTLAAYTENGEGYVLVEPGIAGNAVVCIKVGGDIKWSWHIWVTPAVGSATDPATGLTWMDRNLGAAGTTYDSGGRNGLFYQWGRKDAFPGSDGTAANQTYYIGNSATGTTASLSTGSFTELPGMVRNPLTFASNNTTYYGSLNVAGEDNKSWNNSGAKTLYDPCPPGWKMPASGNWGSDTDWGAWENSGRVFKPATVNHFYPATGFRSVNGSLLSVGSAGYYWSGTGSSTTGGYYLRFNSPGVYPNTSNYRGHGFAARCVKEQ